jgi:ABC-2 type transport system ATP-binding protein
LVGRNGAGKSTLIQILLGLIRPTGGTAAVLGRHVHAAGLALRGSLGYMPERDAFVPALKGLEYVALAGQLCGMPGRQAWRRAHETLSYLGLEEARYRRLEQYSVGMKQRLKLAAALVHDPQVLLLDEPTSGLDPDGRTAMLAMLSSLAARPGKSLVLSSHLLGDIERVCRQAMILDEGRLLYCGPLDTLRTASSSVYWVRWQGAAGGDWLAGLTDQGVRVEMQPGQAEARLAVPADWNSAAVFREALRHQVLLTGLEPDEDDLERVYQRLVLSHAGHRG